MNCLEQDASKATSGDLTAAQSTSLIAMYAHVTNCTKVGGSAPPPPHFQIWGGQSPLAPCSATYVQFMVIINKTKDVSTSSTMPTSHHYSWSDQLCHSVWDRTISSLPVVIGNCSQGVTGCHKPVE